MCRVILSVFLVIGVSPMLFSMPGNEAEVRKIKDFKIYHDGIFNAAFPSIVVLDDGEILCAFRRAPDRRRLWEPKPLPDLTYGYSHTDPNSQLVLVRSNDGGETWTIEPELIYAHPLAGSQDPCMVKLSDGTIIVTSYAWAALPPGGDERLPNTLISRQMHVGHTSGFLGGYIMRSADGGKTWQGPFIPPTVPENATVDALENPLPAYNRGAMIEHSDGKLLWAVARHDDLNDHSRKSVHLIASEDKGETWEYVCPVAKDEKVSFNETSLIETTNGDILAFMRTAHFDGKAAFARSTDGGKSFQPWENPDFIGHPFHAVRLDDGRIFLVYGWRRYPGFGIRAKILNPDGTDIMEAPKIIIRDDGIGSDIGYPWAGLLPDGRIMVAYYIHYSDGIRHIAGSILEIK